MTEAELRRDRHTTKQEEKIKLLQMDFFMKNYENAKEDLEVPKSIMAGKSELDDDIELRRIKIKRMKQELEKFQNEENKRLSGKTDDLPPPIQETELSYMYPIPNDVTIQLYTDISQNGGGRVRYLKTRSELMPKEKYRSNLTHNTQYGWDTEKLKTMSKISRYGRKPYLQCTIHSIHGIHLNLERPKSRAPTLTC